jgi:hypothetical protein
MLTPTRREIVVTAAAKVPAGAQLWGGRHDGAVVRACCERYPLTVLLLGDGSELHLVPVTPVEWLHPAGRRL